MRTIAAVFALASLAVAQDARIANGYKVQITIHETEGGKRLSSRTYTIQVAESKPGRLALSTRVPVPSGGGQSQFFDTGINMTCGVNEVAGQPVLESDLQLTTLADSEPKMPVSTHQLTTRVTTPVTPGKAASIAEFDDVASRRRFVVEATVTKVK